MANVAQANQLDVKQVYGRDASIPMENWIQMCKFHWNDSLHKHIKKHVIMRFKQMHCDLYTQWKESTTRNNKYFIMREWWQNSGTIPPTNIHVQWIISWDGGIQVQVVGTMEMGGVEPNKKMLPCLQQTSMRPCMQLGSCLQVMGTCKGKKIETILYFTIVHNMI